MRLNYRKQFNLVLAACTLLCAGCSVAPVMNPDKKVGDLRLKDIAVQTARTPAKTLPLYLQFVRSQQYFDETLTVYGRDFNAAMDNISRGGWASEVPVDGISYYYLKHLSNFAKGYLNLSRAYLAAGDFPRAERAALNAIQAAEKRAIQWNILTVTEIASEAWGILAEIYNKAGYRGSALWAENQRKLCEDYLSGPEAAQSRRDMATLQKMGEAQLQQGNTSIKALNKQRSQETGALLAGTLSVAASALNSYEQARINAAVSDQGYMTQAQAGQLQTLQLQASLNNILFAGILGYAGRHGDTLIGLQAAASPALFNQLSNPGAGVDPMAILRDYNRRARALGGHNSSIAESSTKLSKTTGDLEQARKSGDRRASEAKTQELLPVLANMNEQLRRIK